MNALQSPAPKPRGARRCRGAASALQLLGVVVLAGLVVYGVGRMIFPEPRPLAQAPQAETRAPAAGATSSAPEKRSTGEVGAVRAGGPAQGIAPTLPNAPASEGQRLTSVAEPPRLSNGGPTAPQRPETLLGQLLDIKQTYASAPKENDLAIRRILRQLSALGPGAVPAMREFLASGEDLAFELVSADGRLLDSKSLRLAMLEVLSAVGGVDGTEVLIDELQSTGNPQEIQAIARLLDDQQPGEYRKLALDATYDALARISRGELGGADTAPLFHLLAEYGDAETIAQLEKSGASWPLYRAVALAEAPEGTGIPGLIRVWQQAGDSSLQQVATQLLAQSAARYPQAGQALVDGLGANKITPPDHLWPKIAQALTGNYELGLLKPDVGALPAELTLNPYRNMSVGGGQGNSATLFITDVQSLSPEERRARLAVVERLLNQNLGPAANRALEQARNTLKH
jgi:hypothetical protein